MEKVLVQADTATLLLPLDSLLPSVKRKTEDIGNKQEASDCSIWRPRFGSGYGSVLKENA